MKKAEKLGNVISKAFKIYYAKPTYEMRELVDRNGVDAARELLEADGVKSKKDVDLYLRYLEEIKVILDEA